MASKSKWKKRLKKIGKVAAIAGAAALAGKLASKRRSASIAGMDDAGIGVTHPALTGGNAVTGTEYPGANVVPPAVKRGVPFDRPTRGRLTLGGKGPMEIARERAATPGHGTAVAPPGILNPYRAPIRMRGRTSVYKHGGKVTGIAKRGFGRALMKGKK